MKAYVLWRKTVWIGSMDASITGLASDYLSEQEMKGAAA